MYRFIALYWNFADETAAAVAAGISAAHLSRKEIQGWQSVHEESGLRIWQSGAREGRMQCLHLKGNRGVVLGQIFRKSPQKATTDHVHNLNEYDSCQCVDSNGSFLIDHFWGRYVAFLNDTRSSSLCVLRDPSGALPCGSKPPPLKPWE